MVRKSLFSEYLRYSFSSLWSSEEKKSNKVNNPGGSVNSVRGYLRRGFLSLAGLFLFAAISFAQVNGDYQTRATGNWNSNAVWQVWSGGAWNNCLAGDYPGAAPGTGSVNIRSSHAVTLNLTPANAIGALTFAPGNTALESVTFSGAWTLNVTGAVTYTVPGVNVNGDQTLAVGTGILNCASVSMVTTADPARIHTLSLSTGTVNVTGGINMVTAVQNAITVTGAGIINIGGDFNIGAGTFTAGTGFVNYNGANQSVAPTTYRNITLSGTGKKTVIGDISVAGNILISNPATFEVTGNVTFTGTNVTNDSNTANAFNQTTGLFTFGLNGAQFINGSGTGSIVFNSLTAGGNNTKTFNLPVSVNNDMVINNGVTVGLGTTAKTIDILGNLTVDGILNFGTVAAKTVNVTGDLLDITGNITMTGAGLAHQLNLNGVNNAITTFTTTAGSVSSVNYVRAGDQNVFGSVNYQGIGISGGGDKVTSGKYHSFRHIEFYEWNSEARYKEPNNFE